MSDESASSESDDVELGSQLPSFDQEQSDIAEASDADDVSEELTPRVETKLAWSGPGRLVFDPVLRQVGASQFRVEGKQETTQRVAWGFWGAVLAVGAVTSGLVGQYSVYSVMDVLWVLVGVAVGVLLYQYGRGSTLDEVVLFEIDQRREVVRWPNDDSDEEWGHEVPFDRVTEAVFGLTRLPVSESTAGVNVDAFTFLLRVDDDTLRPVVEGSPYKGDVHQIAQFTAEMLDVELTYVGRGM